MAAAPKPKVDPNQALLDKYAALGLTNPSQYVKNKKFDANKANTDVIKNIYKLDPTAFTTKGVVNLDLANQALQYKNKGVENVEKYVVGKTFNTIDADKAAYEVPKITKSEGKKDSFTSAVANYSDTLSQAQKVGITNLNAKDQQALRDAAKIVRDFDSKNLSGDARQIITNITGGNDLIDQLNNKKQDIQTKQNLILKKSPDGSPLPKGSKVDIASETKNLSILQSELQSLNNQINQGAPRLSESLSRFGLSDIGINTGDVAQTKKLTTGLEALRGDNMFQTGGLAGRLNVQVTDDQILNDINTARKTQAKSLYDIGTAAVTDLQSQLTQANQFLTDLPTGDRRRVDTQKTVDSISTQLAEAQKDTLEAQKLYEGNQPIAGTQATDAISKFRESLRLPEERTLKQIETIDPTVGATVRALSKEYQTMAETPLAATTNPETEAFRRNVEQTIAGQVALGSQLGAEEQRQYQQAARGAQSARGNIFGIGPAVEEAVTTGLAGEQRLQARLGAAQGFLSSGQSMTDAAARDVGLRNALNQSRLGAAQGFIASGPTMYNMASQRLGTQQGMLNNYLAASAPQATGGFQATPSASNPYAYVNPNAGFMGAQNATSIYNTLADLQSSQYGAQVGAIARGSSGAEQFGQIATGLGNLIKI